MTLKDGPFKSACEGQYAGRIIKQEVITYVLEGNDLDGKKIVKHTATRLPLTKDDYHDSTSSEPLISFDD